MCITIEDRSDLHNARSCADDQIFFWLYRPTYTCMPTQDFSGRWPLSGRCGTKLLLNFDTASVCSVCQRVIVIQKTENVTKQSVSIFKRKSQVKFEVMNTRKATTQQGYRL